MIIFTFSRALFIRNRLFSVFVFLKITAVPGTILILIDTSTAVPLHIEMYRPFSLNINVLLILTFWYRTIIRGIYQTAVYAGMPYPTTAYYLVFYTRHLAYNFCAAVVAVELR